MESSNDLSEFIKKATYSDFPSDVRKQSKKLVLDTLASIYIGTRKQGAVERLLSFLKKKKSKEACTVIGFNIKTSCELAAFTNSALAQVHDGNDGHRVSAAMGGYEHPGRIAIPSALAMAEETSCTGKELLTSIIIGYEVMTRVRRLENRAPAGAYGVSAIASKLLGLSEEKILDSIGISGYLDASPYQVSSYYDVNFLKSGYSAKTGIEAAMLAKEGMTGPSTPISDDKRITKRFTERGLGENFEINNVYIKPYPTCRMTHGPIEAIYEIKEDTEEELKPEKISDITIHHLSEGMYVNKYASKDSPYKKYEFSLPYIAACAIVCDDITSEQFTDKFFHNSDIHELMKKIEVVPDESLDALYPDEGRPTKVDIELKNGTTYSKFLKHPKGGPEKPLSEKELIDKFKKWTDSILSNQRINTLKETIFNLDTIKDISEFTLLLQEKK